MVIRTSVAFVISIIVLLFGFIWGTFFDAPYEYLVMGISGLFGVNSFKRHKDKTIDV